MRVHSSVSYGETELHVCPLCLICYHNSEGLDAHKIQVHPDWENEIQKLREYNHNSQFCSLTLDLVDYSLRSSAILSLESNTACDTRHEKTDLKVFVVVIPKERAYPSFGMTPTFRKYDL